MAQSTGNHRTERRRARTVTGRPAHAEEVRRLGELGWAGTRSALARGGQGLGDGGGIGLDGGGLGLGGRGRLVAMTEAGWGWVAEMGWESAVAVGMGWTEAVVTGLDAAAGFVVER